MSWTRSMAIAIRPSCVSVRPQSRRTCSTIAVEDKASAPPMTTARSGGNPRACAIAAITTAVTTSWVIASM